jgi:hypothetical protein
VAAEYVPIKTPQGQDELSTRQRRLSQRHRTMLFLVDGRRSAPEVVAMARQAGVPEACFDELLAGGLITMAEPSPMPVRAAPVLPVTPMLPMQVDLALPGPDGAEAEGDSVLPPSRTLYPESASADSSLGEPRSSSSWPSSDDTAEADVLDEAFDEAKSILLRAVRSEAPLAGGLTLLRLRRARNRAELFELLDEVEARISKPHRALAATQTMQRVRRLLDDRVDSAIATA